MVRYSKTLSVWKSYQLIVCERRREESFKELKEFVQKK
jgi:hypothetical protein